MSLQNLIFSGLNFRSQIMGFLVKTFQWQLEGSCAPISYSTPHPKYSTPATPTCLFLLKPPQTGFDLRPQALAFPATWSLFSQMSPWLLLRLPSGLCSLPQCSIKSIILRAFQPYANDILLCVASLLYYYIFAVHPGCYIYPCIIYFIYLKY